MIRQAETRDIPFLLESMKLLLLQIEKQGGIDLSENENQLIGGIIEYIALKMHTPGHIILTDGKAMLAGMIDQFPGFMKYRTVGTIEYVYPFSFETVRIVNKFYEWARDKGATAIMCLSNHTRTVSMYRRHRFQPRQLVMMKEF